MNITIIDVNSSLNYIPKVELITLENCLDYCKEATAQNKTLSLIILALLFLLALKYIDFRDLIRNIKKGVKP